MAVGYKEAVAANIRSLCLASGLNQTQIAERAGISKSTLSAYITGVNHPRTKQMERLAEALGVSCADIVGADTGESNYSQLIAVYRDLTPEQQEIILQTAWFFAKRNKTGNLRKEYQHET